MGYVEYSSNNSGGSWWLTDQNWHDLEAAGWIVVWNWLSTKYDGSGGYALGDNGVPVLVKASESGSLFSGTEQDKVGSRFLGALATSAFRAGMTLREAADEWEDVTGQTATDAGCACCGQPHNFTQYDDTGKCIASGPDASYVASW